MCKSKTAADAAEPTPTSRNQRRAKPSTPTATRPPSTAATPQTLKSPLSFDPSSSSSKPSGSRSSGSSYKLDTSHTTASISSRTSLSSLRDSLPENPHIYDFSEIRSATNNFLAKRYSSSSSTPSWRCTLRGKDVMVFQRKFRRKLEASQLKERLAVICRSHHISIIKLLGASLSGANIYLVYEFVRGGNLADCLRNPNIPNFTALSTWISRMQVATDLSHGLDYIHNNTGLSVSLVHKHIKSSSVIVTEPSFNAKICHFGAAELCNGSQIVQNRSGTGEIEEEAPESPRVSRRSGSRTIQFEGITGYMSPEYQATGIATQKSDVYAFGVVILELLSGTEPVRYKFDREGGDYRRISVVETAREAVEGLGGEGEGAVEARLRRWVDRRLNDSFPVEVAVKLTRLALECVSVDPTERPDMTRVAGKVSKMYLASRKWAERTRVPTEITVSLGPR